MDETSAKAAAVVGFVTIALGLASRWADPASEPTQGPAKAAHGDGHQDGRAGTPSEKLAPSPQPLLVADDFIPQNRELQEKQKDRGRYYSAPTMKKLVKLAMEGDEWAVREVAWPKGHPLHEKGRPYFRNTGPHPGGLFPHSGF